MPDGSDYSRFEKIVRIIVLVLALYFFLASINLMSSGARGMGEDFARSLLQTASNPFVGLFIGILITSIVQSSSVTTSLVVAMVASGTFGEDPETALYVAIPIIMGANMGTTVTNTLVSLGHATRREEFRRAFSAATLHDFFNILSVVVFFPLQVLTNFLGKISYALGSFLVGTSGLQMTSPLKVIIDPVIDLSKSILGSPELLFILGIAMLFICLKFLVDSMKFLVTFKLGKVLDKTMGKPLHSFITGLSFTALVQSSSIMTSLVVPLAGAGLVTLEQILPYTMGANIGTTVTALLAALSVGGVIAISVALSHLIFNVLSILLWYPLRFAPINLAKKLAAVVKRRRYIALLYVLSFFIIIPLLIVIISTVV